MRSEYRKMGVVVSSLANSDHSYKLYYSTMLWPLSKASASLEWNFFLADKPDSLQSRVLLSFTQASCGLCCDSGKILMTFLAHWPAYFLCPYQGVSKGCSEAQTNPSSSWGHPVLHSTTNKECGPLIVLVDDPLIDKRKVATATHLQSG